MTGHKISLADEAVITALTAKQAELETEIEYLHNELASMKTGPYSDLLKENRKLRHELAVLVHGIDAESERLREQLTSAEREACIDCINAFSTDGDRSEEMIVAILRREAKGEK